MISDQTVNNLADKVQQGLQMLAEKMGTTIQQIWTVYVAQARVEAIRDSVLAVVLLAVGTYAALKVGPRFYSKFKESDYSEEIGWMFGAVFITAGGMVCIGFGISNIYNAIGEWANPSYWAFQHLTADLKGLF